MKNNTTIPALFILFLLSGVQAALAVSNDAKINQIIQNKAAPAGVVFEIVTNKANSLEWALPKAQHYIKILRNKFPDLAITIVTHGSEQFSLQTKNTAQYKKVHSLTQQLVKENDVPLHVCGTYASWKNVEKEDFPDYVDVTAAGPATINDYVNLGYILIIIKK